MKHDEVAQKMTISNAVLISYLSYREVDTNLWILSSFGDYHFNTMYRFIYYKNLPVQHHLLVFYYDTQDINNAPFLTHNYSCPNYGWLFQKPNCTQSSFHFKNTKVKYINIYIPDCWIQDMLDQPDSIFANDCKLRTYFTNESKKFISLDSNNDDNPDQIISKTELLFNKEITPIVIDELKTHTIGLIQDFVNLYNTNYKEQLNDIDISDEVRRKMFKAEHFILEHLFVKFPTLEEIAKEINYSVTPLKTNFKLLYGESVFQYYRNKQLEYAKKVFSESNETVATVAKKLNYGNSTKFSNAFKEKFGKLPSDFKKSSID